MYNIYVYTYIQANAHTTNLFLLVQLQYTSCNKRPFFSCTFNLHIQQHQVTLHILPNA